MPWNSRKLGSTWAIKEAGVDQVGCVHTAQGLEFDYVGVLIGSDLRFLDGQQAGESGLLFDEEVFERTDAGLNEISHASDDRLSYKAHTPRRGSFYSNWKEYHDAKGKSGLKDQPAEMCRMIRNIFRILLTCGMKGCCVYISDKPLEQYFRERLEKATGKTI
ncbi:DUF2075 domain-containing protein [Balneolaceae bacterium ANBcel3]|nr:DUF2075 domain-containing protein [Balneolaceae bacterium ANBcel3]